MKTEPDCMDAKPDGVAVRDQAIVPVRKKIEDELFLADWPNQQHGCEGMDKYDLRKWLIGHAVLNGWQLIAVPHGAMQGSMVSKPCGDEGVVVSIRPVSGGLKVSTTTREIIVPTTM